MKKTALSGLFVPIVSSVRFQKTFGTCTRLYLAVFPLFFTSGTNIETPEAESDTFGLAVRIVFCAEQPVGYLGLYVFCPQTDAVHAPGIRSTEIFHGLAWMIGFNGERSSFLPIG